MSVTLVRVSMPMPGKAVSSPLATPQPKSKMGRKISVPDPVIGSKFGRLTVLHEFRPHEGQRESMAECSCGKVLKVVKCRLLDGRTTSCGCYERELTSQRSATHRMTGSPEYRSWTAMKGRCYSETHPDYHNYGARGIVVHESWLAFEAFYVDMGSKPGPGFSLERLDTMGNYVPGNVIWADSFQQNNNRRSSVRLEYKGQLYTYEELSKLSGIAWKTLHSRITRSNWSVERAVETPTLSHSEASQLPSRSALPGAIKHKLYPQQPTTTPS